MAQWVNRLRNKIFVNLPPLPLLCEISGALHLAQPGLTSILSMVSIKTKKKKVIIYFISWSLLYMLRILDITYTYLFITMSTVTATGAARYGVESPSIR